MYVQKQLATCTRTCTTTGIPASSHTTLVATTLQTASQEQSAAAGTHLYDHRHPHQLVAAAAAAAGGQHAPALPREQAAVWAQVQARVLGAAHMRAQEGCSRRGQRGGESRQRAGQQQGQRMRIKNEKQRTRTPGMCRKPGWLPGQRGSFAVAAVLAMLARLPRPATTHSLPGQCLALQRRHIPAPERPATPQARLKQQQTRTHFLGSSGAAAAACR